MPLRPLWCTIFQIGGKHATDNFHLLQKYMQTCQQFFCNFCRLVVYDECTVRSYELMMDRTESRALDQMQGWHALDFRGANKVEVEWD